MALLGESGGFKVMCIMQLVLYLCMVYGTITLVLYLVTGTILIPLVIAYLPRPWNTHRLPLVTVIRGALVVLVPSVTCGRGITPLRGHPCSQTLRSWALNSGCLCVDTTLDRIRPLSQPQTTTSAMHCMHTITSGLE